MVRAAAIVCALWFTTSFGGVAAAEPPAEDQKDEKSEKSEKKQVKKADKKKSAKPADLRLKDPHAPRINLFPTKVLQNRSKTERERRLTLGDDGDWKVHAAQAGVMVGLFGALVGLCGNAKCLVPKKVTDALPDWMRAEHPTYTNPRREQKVRQIR